MKVLVVGGAGFIGSYVVDYLLANNLASAVVVYDNFSSGQRWHLRHHAADKRLTVWENDIGDPALLRAAEDADLTIHLASNADIAKAVVEPDIDFRQGTTLTQTVLEAVRKAGCRHVLYASGSGVYGDTGNERVAEDFTPMRPISTYGASKLAGEALICAYCAMFDLKAFSVSLRQCRRRSADPRCRLRLPAQIARRPIAARGHGRRPSKQAVYRRG